MEKYFSSSSRNSMGLFSSQLSLKRGFSVDNSCPMFSDSENADAGCKNKNNYLVKAKP
jgi:hypothetical protein